VKTLSDQFGERIQLYDTVGVTNSTFAASQAADAVHFRETVTFAEMEVLLNLVCPRQDDSKMKGRDLNQLEKVDLTPMLNEKLNNCLSPDFSASHG